MKALVNVLKSRYFLIGFGMCLLIAGVLILGAWFAWSMTVQLLAIIGVLIVCILVLALSMARANKSAAQIEQSIKAQAAQQRMSARPDRAAEVEELQKQLEAAIEKLKQSKLGRGRSGKAALYALPWYMFIGPPGTGKTTAIANSGLNFPLGTNRIRGVGGTRNCDWFFTDSAILLDTAGRYMTEAEDTEEWHAFLETLKKHRPDRPINGIIVGVSISDLAGATVDEIEWHAANIRHRIDELLGRLGVRFPVYLLFTKCDLLQGFVEFFGEMSRKERDQIWGATLDHEQQRNPDVRVVFEREFQQLYDVLLNLRTSRLGRSMKREERHKVYVFPLEFASIKDNLSLFVSRLFQPNPYQESPTFRGFYFTSGTQEGAPIDRVIQAIAQQFDLPPTVDVGFDQEVETKSYFIKDLFTDVIVPDQYMVRQTSRSATKGRMLRAGTAVAALVVLALFAIATSQALIRSMGDLGAAQTAAALVEPVRWSNPSTIEDELTRMDGLRERIDGLEAFEEDPPLLRLGLYRGGTILQPARSLYFDRVRTFVDGYAMRKLEGRLQNAAGAILSGQGSERDSLYNDLRAYLLMTSETGQLQEEINVAFLTRYLTALTARDVVPRVSPASEGMVLEQLRRQAEAYATGLSRGVVAPFEGNTGMIARVRQIVYEPPSVQRVYDRLKEEGGLALQPFTLSEALQGRYLEMFSSRPEVPGFFTKTGWQTYVEQAIQDETEAPDRVDWVMGYVEEDLPESMRNQEQLAAQLQEIYFNEYAANWERFLRSIRVNRFNDMRTASRYMTDLGNSYDSPLLYILAQVTNQTRFGGGLTADLADRAGNVAERKAEQKLKGLLGGRDGEIERSEQETLHPVDRRFKRLHDLNADKAQSGGASPALVRALESLAKVGGTLDGMAGDGAKSADYAQKILSGDGGELRSHAETIQSALGLLDPEVRGALFVQPIYFAWETVLGEARQFLNGQWQDQVVRPYRERLAGRYPLDLGSDSDAAIEDFERFFQPQTGALATFFNTTLAPFLSRDGRSARSWEGRGVAVSPSVFAARDQAKQIGEGLYGGGVLKMEFELQPDQPIKANPNAPAVSNVEIDVHGRTNSYGMGSYRPWTQFVWPGRPGASLRLSTQSGPASLEFSGDWAWFRMLQVANPQRRSATEYEILWPLSNGITARYTLRTRSSNNPFSNLRAFFNFDLPESLSQ